MCGRGLSAECFEEQMRPYAVLEHVGGVRFLLSPAGHDCNEPLATYALQLVEIEIARRVRKAVWVQKQDRTAAGRPLNYLGDCTQGDGRRDEVVRLSIVGDEIVGV